MSGQRSGGGQGDRGRNDRARNDRGRNDRPPRRGSITSGDGRDSDLPGWVRDEIARVTAKERREPTMRLLSDAAHSYSAGKYPQALPKLLEAKKLSSRTATIRELLGLTLYHTGQWDRALQELRTFRRLSGETTHMAEEMDCLRALDRPGDVEKTWQLLRELGGDAATKSEARVVYASHLLDEGRAKDAWKVIGPKRIEKQPSEAAAREWFVAARAANALGDGGTARQLVAGITRFDPDYPGLAELTDEVGAS
jgi:uncharacterized protein HemY